MLDINNSDDLLNYIVFHKEVIPSYISSYEFDTYQLERLNRLLMRINTNHKTLFFASSPVFVEGYIDQQLLNLIEYKRDIPLGAEGVSIIDVGGKDEVDIMFTLCQKLGISAKAIVDLDALFEGKIRQTIANLPESSKYLAEQGQKELMAIIGELQTLSGEIADFLITFDLSSLNNPSSEFSDFLATLKKVHGEHALKIKRRLTFLAVQRISDEISQYINDAYRIKLSRAKALATYAINCFELSNVYVLAKGEIENYYSTYLGNQYVIADSNKADYFLAEYDCISALPQEQLLAKYPDLVELLDKLCPITTVDIKRMVAIKLSDWIHAVQSLFRINNSITKETIETHPKTQWNAYKRIIDLIDFVSDQKTNTFVCRFQIKSRLLKDCDTIYEFTQDTVPARFLL